ncbi:TonB-dependent receptor [uncultured Croceicoccus sp.]|uniref:TonB-dependent receptor n=1 Tax=uncultured Croceicoccus sp. TaxID=1295329 RepID=UPI00260C5A3E|nr:TonB-dependent receptor [uncultured Croceicoccus sp.]
MLSSIRNTLAIGTAAAAILAAPAAWAGTIEGSVVDDTGTRALQSAQVRILELDRVASTMRDGAFRFVDVPGGTYTVEVRYVGAEPETQTVTVPETGTVRPMFTLGGSAQNILVIGQLANQASALSRKREGDGVSSVLTRDAIGQFPDQNVAESLRRLPGLNILNDQGEGRFVSVRGLSPNLNSSSINGARIPAPESDTRSVALDVISSDQIESIEVKKSLTPDMDADTIGASIEINTVSAFDRKRDLYTARVEGSYNRLADTLTPKLGFDFSTKLSDDFGIAGGVSYYKRKFETDNVEAEDWKLDDDGNALFEEIQYRDYDVERERLSASLSFDWRASDTTELYLRGLYSQFDDHEFRRRLTFDLGDFDTVSFGGGNALGFTASDDAEIQVERDIKDRAESQKIRSIVLGGETDAGDWRFEYAGSYARSTERENDSIDPTTFDRDFATEGDGDNFGLVFDLTNPRIPTFTVDARADLFADPAQYALNDVEVTRLSASQDEEFALWADIGRTFALASGDFTVQAGAKARWREKSYDFNVQFYEDATGEYTLADVLGRSTYRLQGIDPVADFTAPTRYFFDNFGDFELQEIDSTFDSAVEDYVNKEDVYAGYALGRWDSETWRIIAGVRMEHTRNDISANLTELIEEGAEYDGAVLDDDIVVITPNRFERDYTDWLPSVNMRYEPVRNLVFRAAGYKSLVRPNLADLAPRFIVEENDDNEREGEFGNPGLRPYKAWNLDAAAEYYFTGNGAITANVFYKDVKNFIVDRQLNEEDSPYSGIDFTEAVVPVNGRSATVFGAEFGFSSALAFLPAPLDGLVVQANYTYTDAQGTLDDGREIPLPTASKHTFNAVLGYEKGPVSLRVAGTFRDKYLDELGSEAEEDRYVDDLFQIDASARYRLTRQIQLYWEWVNANDADFFAYQNLGGARRLLQYEEYDWTMKFGARFNF